MLLIRIIQTYCQLISLSLYIYIYIYVYIYYIYIRAVESFFKVGGPKKKVGHHGWPTKKNWPKHPKAVP